MARGGKRISGGYETSQTEELEPEDILKNCEQALKTVDTDWDSIYLRVRSSALGEDFPRERFLRTPVRSIIKVLQFIDNEEQRHINLQSGTTAQLAVQIIHIAHAMSGARGQKPKIQPKDFLPFPDWSPESAKNEGPTPETRTLLTKLLKQRRISMAVYAQLVTPPEVSR